MMREEILEAAAAVESPGEKSDAMRECIQAVTLRSLHESGAFASLCLTGDAALRFAGDPSSGLISGNSNGRPATGLGSGHAGYATDLEFRLVDKKGYRPEQWFFTVRRRLRSMGLDARIAFARRGPIHSGWIKVSGLLAEAGLSPSPDEALGFTIVIGITPLERAACRVKIVEAAGECFALRYRIPDTLDRQDPTFRRGYQLLTLSQSTSPIRDL